MIDRSLHLVRVLSVLALILKLLGAGAVHADERPSIKAAPAGITGSWQGVLKVGLELPSDYFIRNVRKAIKSSEPSPTDQ